MRVTLAIHFDCGETTCASRPGLFCRFCRTDLKGTGRCLLYRVVLYDDGGWLRRCAECVEGREP